MPSGSVIPRAQLWEVCLPTAEAKLRRCCGVAAPLASNGRPPFRRTRGADVQVGKRHREKHVFSQRDERDFERRETKQRYEWNIYYREIAITCGGMMYFCGMIPFIQ